MNECDICGEDLLNSICACDPEALAVWPNEQEEDNS